MRIAIGGLSHETNTFVPRLTIIDDFQAGEWLQGEEIIRSCHNVRSYIGGMIAAAKRLGVELVPTFLASAEPSGPIAHAAYEQMRNKLLDAIQAAGELDGLCLALHGAGVVAGLDDLEGALLVSIRERFGLQWPIVATLDLHCNPTQAMLNHADALLNVHQYPHTDAYERGSEALELVTRIVKGDVRPVMHLVSIPLLIAGAPTNAGPADEINNLCFELEATPGIVDCAFCHGFPFTDIPGAGASVLATSDGDPVLARQVAERVAQLVWQARERFLPTIVPAEEAIRRALEIEGRPVILNEQSDNPGGGAPGDGTHLLRAMLDARLSDACFGFIFDPGVAAQAHAAGPGATIDVQLGGKLHPLHGSPIVAPAYVKTVSDGRFVTTSAVEQGAQVNLGRMSRLVIEGIDVLVGSVRTQVLDPEVFLLHGIDIARYKIVALKSSHHFRAAFEPVAAAIIRADTPGLVSVDLSRLPYQRLRRPIWPLDPTTPFPLTTKRE